MTLKQFLKPDWRKIVVSAILFLVITLGNYYDNIICTAGVNVPLSCYRFFSPSTLMASLLLFSPDSFFRVSILEPRIKDSIFQIPFWILDFVLFYFLSCFAVWIYDKIKKK